MPESMSGRTLLCFCWIFFIVMMATYSGNLIAFLTIEKHRLPINNFADLITQDKYKWGITGGTAHETVFKVKHSLPAVCLYSYYCTFVFLKS